MVTVPQDNSAKHPRRRLVTGPDVCVSPSDPELLFFFFALLAV